MRSEDILEPFSIPQLSQTACNAYIYAANRIQFLPQELARDLGMTPETASEAIAELEALCLLQGVLDAPGALAPVAPELAAAQLLAPMEQHTRTWQLTIDRTRSQLQSLIPQYEASAAHRKRAEVVELVTDLAAVRAFIQDAANRCTMEVLTSQPGGSRPKDVLDEAKLRDEEMLRRGVAMRTIYQHSARFHQPTIDYVKRVSELGARVRTAGDGLMRMLIFDATVGIVEVPDDPSAALIIREPNIVGFMRAVFERTWLRASEFPETHSREQVKALSDETKEVIVSLLAEGMDDQSIARRLGVSARTCQRHISEVMNRIGAKSRFQAGYLLRDVYRPGSELSRSQAGYTR
ncbi:helix-turn-helix transcriptional regulator [Streptomyces sp. LX-29]|uniref:helix-turn-helix transcriptional regulator n=1 Tax=Streptomyces sp. LX-29 TaxID=2900152 RepID=UPI00240E6687|nr:helix-turn-helix transcriptional regulator [Streptomyces sp. LX-29]WFB06739.1 helix-turn-helix transcriptional regulator [Streptomyces sp. LX-29]